MLDRFYNHSADLPVCQICCEEQNPMLCSATEPANLQLSGDGMFPGSLLFWRHGTFKCDILLGHGGENRGKFNPVCPYSGSSSQPPPDLMTLGIADEDEARLQKKNRNRKAKIKWSIYLLHVDEICVFNLVQFFRRKQL